MITKNVKTRRDYLKQHTAAQGELKRHRLAEVASFTKQEFTLKGLKRAKKCRLGVRDW